MLATDNDDDDDDDGNDESDKHIYISQRERTTGPTSIYTVTSSSLTLT